MTNNVNKDDLKVLGNSLEVKIDKAVDDLTDVIKVFMHHVDERFNKLKARMDEFDLKLDKLTSTIDGFVARIDHYETEQTARDSQFEKLLIWARKVSEKTGIPLENL